MRKAFGYEGCPIVLAPKARPKSIEPVRKPKPAHGRPAKPGHHGKPARTLGKPGKFPGKFPGVTPGKRRAKKPTRSQGAPRGSNGRGAPVLRSCEAWRRTLPRAPPAPAPPVRAGRLRLALLAARA